MYSYTKYSNTTNWHFYFLLILNERNDEILFVEILQNDGILFVKLLQNDGTSFVKFLQNDEILFVGLLLYCIQIFCLGFLGRILG